LVGVQGCSRQASWFGLQCRLKRAWGTATRQQVSSHTPNSHSRQHKGDSELSRATTLSPIHSPRDVSNCPGVWANGRPGPMADKASLAQQCSLFVAGAPRSHSMCLPTRVCLSWPSVPGPIHLPFSHRARACWSPQCAGQGLLPGSRGCCDPISQIRKTRPREAKSFVYDPQQVGCWPGQEASTG
jgi:hypothetical protein